jgi:iron(III) transport system ATP-binding protein
MADGRGVFVRRHRLSGAEGDVGGVGIGIEQISKQFTHRVKGLVYAVRDVSLAVQPGELLTLLGPSGCGKTTTLRMIAGFERPDTGRVLIGDQDVTGLMANERNIGFVFQNYALFPHLTIFENVAYGLRVKKMPGQEIAAAVHEVLQMVGLAGYDRQYPHQLSGGEQQRVALARAIVIRPRVLLFDEPLSNLDAKLRVHMRREIQQLQKQLAITAVYVTHDQEEAMAISDRIVVMNQGSIVQQGTAEALYRRPASEFVAQFIGRTNLVAGRVLAVEGSSVVLDIQGRHHRLEAEVAGTAAGRPVQLVARPEAVTLAAGPDAAGWPATVLARTFLGEKVEYHVRMGEATLQVSAYNPREVLAPGQAVTVGLPTSGAPLLPGGEG